SPPPGGFWPEPPPSPQCGRGAPSRPASAPPVASRDASGRPTSSPVAPSWSTFTCSGVERRAGGPPALALPAADLRRRGRGDADRARRRQPPAPRRWLSGAGPRLGTGTAAGRAAGGPARSALGQLAWSDRRRSGSRGGPLGAGPGAGEDALRARRRRRPRRVLPPLPRRSAAWAVDSTPTLPATPPAPLAVGGARLGGGQAADRVRPRGPDPAPHRRALGVAARQRARCVARRADAGADRRPRAG